MALPAVSCSPAQEGSGTPQSYSGGQAACSCEPSEQSSWQSSGGRFGCNDLVSASAHVDVGDNALKPCCQRPLVCMPPDYMAQNVWATQNGYTMVHHKCLAEAESEQGTTKCCMMVCLSSIHTGQEHI